MPRRRIVVERLGVFSFAPFPRLQIESVFCALWSSPKRKRPLGPRASLARPSSLSWHCILPHQHMYRNGPVQSKAPHLSTMTSMTYFAAAQHEMAATEEAARRLSGGGRYQTQRQVVGAKKICKSLSLPCLATYRANVGAVGVVRGDRDRVRSIDVHASLLSDTYVPAR